MGLDMYLYLRKREHCSQYEKPELCGYPAELKEFEEEIKERSFVSIDKTIDYQIGYWRKDNAIHNYFVEVCGGGVDECQEIYVDIKSAKELIKRCEKILEDHSFAKILLPTCEGFFFGGQEYDEWYFNAIKYTLDLMRKVVKFVEENKGYVIVYEASW